MKGEIKMKKILFAIAIVLTLGLTANAQNKQDSFFDWDDNSWSNRDISNSIVFIMPQNGLGDTGNEPAPLGSGLLVLTALGAGYAIARKKDNK